MNKPWQGRTKRQHELERELAAEWVRNHWDSCGAELFPTHFLDAMDDDPLRCHYPLPLTLRALGASEAYLLLLKACHVPVGFPL